MKKKQAILDELEEIKKAMKEQSSKEHHDFVLKQYDGYPDISHAQYQLSREFDSLEARKNVLKWILEG